MSSFCTGVLCCADLDFSGLADSIVEQVNIGTTIKSGGEEKEESESEGSESEGSEREVKQSNAQAQEAQVAQEDGDDAADASRCGFLTCLNLRQFSEKAKAWRKGLECRHTGASTRFVNLPLELAPMLHKGDAEENIQWSQTFPSSARERRRVGA